jgi:type I restriction enzyme M protein
LVEAFKHLEAQVQTVEDHHTLHHATIFGGEAKPLPYLLCQMNLLLHGLESPRIDPGNSLRQRLSEIGDRERVDVILTNPPFGGEEEQGIINNFPGDKQTSETALLFLQLIMRKLRRQPRLGRAGVVVPNGTLFADGVAARIKEELLKEFNLHTIVRLSNGVFAPYTGIPTNLLFFERGGPTKEIWYYSVPLPEGRNSYTKTKPMQFEEFADCLAWWDQRQENEHAWKMPVSNILKYDAAGNLISVNLDIRNPKAAPDMEHLPPEQLVDEIIKEEQQILALMSEVENLLASNKYG